MEKITFLQINTGHLNLKMAQKKNLLKTDRKLQPQFIFLLLYHCASWIGC